MSNIRRTIVLRGRDGRLSRINAAFDCSYDVELVSRFTGDDGETYYEIPILVDGEQHVLLTKMLGGKLIKL
jgi:hypothetical protein